MNPRWDPSKLPRADRTPAIRRASTPAARDGGGVALGDEQHPPDRRRRLVLLLLLLAALLVLGVLIWVVLEPDERRQPAPALQPAALAAARYVVADETRDWRTACELETPAQHQGLTVDQCVSTASMTPASLVPTFRHGTATCAGQVSTNPARVRVLVLVDRTSLAGYLIEVEQQPDGRWLTATRRGPALDPPPPACPAGTQPLNPPPAA